MMKQVIGKQSEFTERLTKAISRLMKLMPDGDRARISVPILYPSGSSAAVEVVFNSGKCFVTDLALGQMESEMHGADSFYDSAARKAAERFGVKYDGLSVFAAWASIEGIEGAIASVANASVAAAVNSIYKAAEEKEKGDKPLMKYPTCLQRYAILAGIMATAVYEIWKRLT